VRVSDSVLENVSVIVLVISLLVAIHVGESTETRLTPNNKIVASIVSLRKSSW